MAVNRLERVLLVILAGHRQQNAAVVEVQHHLLQ